jgi:hypothetical protein
MAVMPPPTPAAPAAASDTLEAPPAAPVRERAFNRFTARDYTYVRRELLRIAVLAVCIVIALVIISFFLP